MRIKKTSQTTSVPAQIVNAYNTSQTDGYSCDYINKMDVYSTTETKTNKVWINNKPIYRKVIDFGALPNSSEKFVDPQISNLDVITDFRGVAYNTTERSQIPLPNISTSGTQYYVDLFFTNTQTIRIRTASDRTVYYAYVTLEYTKTTD